MLLFGNGYRDRYKPERTSYKRRKVSEFIIDETEIKIGKNYFWIWVTIEPNNKTILGIHISIERNMFIVEQFLQGLVKKYGKHPISTDGEGTWYLSTSLQIFKTKASFTFIVWEKHY
jgi:putative transposase